MPLADHFSYHPREVLENVIRCQDRFKHDIFYFHLLGNSVGFLSGLEILFNSQTELKRQTKHPKLAWRDRPLIILLASKLRTWKGALIMYALGHPVPDTVSRCHCELFKRF